MFGEAQAVYTHLKDVYRHHRLNGHEFEQTPGVGTTEKPGVLQSMRSQKAEHD